MDRYAEFLARKTERDADHGFEAGPLPADLYGFQERIVRWALRRGRAAIFAECGMGKAQPVDEPVLTPSGWRPIGALRVGDDIVAGDGSITSVLGVYPQGVRETVDVRFSDGASTRCDWEHLWTVRSENDSSRSKPWRTLTTREIARRGLFAASTRLTRQWRVPVVGAVALPERALPLDPYLLGVLLGDGSFRGPFSVVFTSADREIVSAVAHALPPPLRVVCVKGTGHLNAPTYRLSGPHPGWHSRNPVRMALERWQLWGHYSHEKWVPDEYLFASAQQRLSLLQGLLDTDGYVSKDGMVIQFSSSSRRLTDGVVALVRSLGGVAYVAEKLPTYTHRGERREGLPHWTATIALPNGLPAFRLTRKLARVRSHSKYHPARKIDSIQAAGVAEAVCIAVAHPSRLYVTRDYVVTHNTPMSLAWAHAVAEHEDGQVLILAPLAVSQQTVREGEKFSLPVTYARSQEGAVGPVVVTNYEMLDRFDAGAFVGVVLDESSCLKAYSGTRKKQILTAFRDTPYRLACTATPAPNDHMELGNHSEFLGVMSSHRMLARWFLNDTTQAGVWRLKRHGAVDFWRWVASWAVALELPSDIGFSDAGFVLPGMRWETHAVDVDVTEARGEHHGQAALFRDPSLSATTMHAEMRRTSTARCAEVARLVRSQPDEQWIVWCNTNYEADELVRLMPEATEVRGSESIDAKERKVAAFLSGDARICISKPSILGWGLNLQRCARMAFVGLSYSYEALYQAIRRCYRFGQSREVEAHVVCAATEGAVLATILRKQAQHGEMKAALRSAVREVQMDATDRKPEAPRHETAFGPNWTLALGDVVQRIETLEDNSVGLTVTSPPFSSLYTYSDSLHDMGNCADDATFLEHFGFLVRDLFRVTMPGRLACIHVKNLVDYMGSESQGRSGLRDFRGDVIRLFEACGWKWHSEVCIWKCPVTEMQRTKSHGLLYKQLRADSSFSRMGIAEYVLAFRAWKGEVASPVEHTEADFPLDTWQRYASPVWMDIDQTDVLNARGARADDDEKHICPLQLGVIRRCVDLWSNLGDVVLDPFAGIGSVGVVALQHGRRFVGYELKPEYWEQARRNVGEAVRQGDLFAQGDQP